MPSLDTSSYPASGHTMSGFPGSPRLLKGGLVLLDPDSEMSRRNGKYESMQKRETAEHFIIKGYFFSAPDGQGPERNDE